MLDPAELLRAAADCGVTTFALTDHDTLAGYREMVAAGSIPPTVELIAGVEINSIVREEIGLWEGELHVLGLGMDPDDDGFEAALVAQRERGLQRRLVALQMDEAGVPRHGQVVWADGESVGQVTSGTKSPTLGAFIALAYVATAHAERGARLTVEIRGRQHAAHVVERPFYRRAR